MRQKLEILKSKKTSEPFGGYENKKPILIDRNKIGLVKIGEVWEGDLIEKNNIFIFYPIRMVESEIKINFYSDWVRVEIINPKQRRNS